jgi:hypothetical protein
VVVCAVLGSLSEDTVLEFFDASDSDNLRSYVVRENLQRVDHLEWDPSGRYLVTATTQPIGAQYYKFAYNNGAHP